MENKSAQSGCEEHGPKAPLLRKALGRHRRFRRIQGREIYDEGRPLPFGSLKCDLPKMLVNDRFHDAHSQPIALERERESFDTLHPISLRELRLR